MSLINVVTPVSSNVWKDVSNVIKLLSNAFVLPEREICISPGGGTLICVVNAAGGIVKVSPSSNVNVLLSNLVPVCENPPCPVAFLTETSLILKFANCSIL